jgi:hypothetical protein
MNLFYFSENSNYFKMEQYVFKVESNPKLSNAGNIFNCPQKMVIIFREWRKLFGGKDSAHIDDFHSAGILRHGASLVRDFPVGLDQVLHAPHLKVVEVA